MASKLEFDIPSDKKVRLVVIAIIVVSIVDIAMFGSLVEAEVVPSGRLGILDRQLLAGPFLGLLWIVFAGFGRKHTAGYYFRYRYGQTLGWVLFITASSVGTNTVFVDFDPSSYGSALGYFYMVLFVMFVIWGLVVSVVAIPIILWRSTRISTRSSYQIAEDSHPKSNQYVADPKSRDGSRSDRRTSGNKGSSQSSTERFKSGDRTQVENHTVQAPSLQKSSSQRPTPYKTQAEKREETEQKVKAEIKSVQENSNKKSLTERDQELIDESADELYAIAWEEVEAGNTNTGLWARLYVKHASDEAKTKAAYIGERVKQMLQQREQEARQQERLEKEKLEEEKQLPKKRQAEELLNQETEQERDLLAKLRNIRTLPDWLEQYRREDYIGNYVRLKQAIRAHSVDNVLRLIRNGTDPTGILTESDQSVRYALSSDADLKYIITVATRLRSKKLLTVDGIKE